MQPFARRLNVNQELKPEPPPKQGLLLIDLQNDYFPGGKFELFQANQAVRQAEKVLLAFRRRELPVFHVQHITLNQEVPFFWPSTTGVEIHKTLAPAPGEAVIIKHAPDSFFQTSLQQDLKSKGVEHLVVCGMMTHMCVDTTVRAAANFGYGVTLLADACATKDLGWNNIEVPAPQVQAAFMAAMNGVFAEVLTTQSYLDQF